MIVIREEHAGSGGMIVRIDHAPFENRVSFTNDEIRDFAAENDPAWNNDLI